MKEKIRSSIKISMLLIIILLLLPITLQIQFVKGGFLEQNLSSRSLNSDEFHTYRPYSETDLLYRAAAGDLMPERDGIELATCSRNGRIAVTYGSDVSWDTEIVHTALIANNPNEPAQVTSIAIGDVLPERPGDELISVDHYYSVKLIQYDGNAWKTETIWMDDDWLFEVAIGELQGDIEQPEIVVVDDSRRLIMVYRNGLEWNARTLFIDAYPLDSCFIDDILIDEPGNEIVVGGGDQNLTVLYHEGDTFAHIDISFIGDVITDVLTTDIDPTIPGKEILASTKSGKLYMVYRSGDIWEKRIIHNEGRTIYGIESGIIEDVNVLSIATYNNRICLIWYSNGIQVREVYREEYIMMGTGIFDVDPIHKGSEVIGLSGLGYLTILYREDPGALIRLPFDSTRISLFENITIPFMVKNIGDYEGRVHLSCEGDIGHLSNEYLDDDGFAFLIIDNADSIGDFNIMIRATTTISTTSTNIKIIVKDENRKVGFDIDEYQGEIGADKQLEIDLQVLSQVDIASPFTISSLYEPKGMDLSIDKTICDPLGSPIPINVIMTCAASMIPNDYMFFIIGNTKDGIERAIGFMITVRERSIADFRLILGTDNIEVMIQTTVNVPLMVLSINGFSSNISIDIAESVDGVIAEFSNDRISPTNNLTVFITVTDTNGPFFLRIQGSSQGLIREDILKIDPIPAKTALVIEPLKMDIYWKRTSPSELTAEWDITLKPMNGTIDDLELKVLGLPSSYSLHTSPGNFERIPYIMNLTIIVSGPSENAPDNITLCFISDENMINSSIKMNIKKEPSNENNINHTITKVMIVSFILLIVLLLVVLLIFSRTNSLNQKERLTKTDEGHKRHYRNN